MRQTLGPAAQALAETAEAAWGCFGATPGFGKGNMGELRTRIAGPREAFVEAVFACRISDGGCWRDGTGLEWL